MQLNVNSKYAIRKLAKNDLHTEKKQSKLIILTIVVSMSLLLTFILVMSSIWQQDYDKHKDEAQLVISNVSDVNIEKLKKQTHVDWVSEQAVVGATKKNGITLIVQYEDMLQLSNQSKVKYSGALPSLENEIMVSENFLDSLKNTSQIGDSISLDLTGKGVKNNYVISGIYEEDTSNDGYRYEIFVSKLGAIKLVGREKLRIDAYVRLDLDKDIEKEINPVALSIAENLGVSENEISLNTTYPFGGVWYCYRNTLKTVFPVVLLLMVLAGAVIYSIFAISISRKVQIYGRLRIIGMTQKQMRLLVRTEALILARGGIILGLVLGWLMGFILHPLGFELLAAVIWGGVISGFIFVMVLLATNLPAKIASRISPLEGAKYLPYTGKYKATHRLQRTLSIFNLAVINLGRNRKKTISTMAAMSICGICLVIFSSIGQSYSAIKAQRFYFYPHGDMQINISSLGSSSFADDNVWREGIVQYTDNPLTDELMNQISEIDGINKVTPATAIYVNIEREDGWSDSAMQPSISKETFLQMQPAFVEGSVDYESLVQNHGILVAQSEQNSAQVGDIYKVTMVGEGGNTIDCQMPVMAVYSQDVLLETSPVVPIPAYLFAQDTIKSLTGIENDRYCFELDIEPKQENEVELQLRQIVNQNENLELNYVKTLVGPDQESTNNLVRTVYLLIAILFIFSIINLINTVLSNMYSRRRELGLLQAQGMTAIQINRMLQIENFFYTLGTGVVVLLAGSFIGGYVCKIVDMKLHCISYQYPVIIVIAYLGSLSIIHCLISAYTTYDLKKESVIERIRSDS